MDHRENILNIVKAKGPLLPSQINKALQTNVLFASAMLSEMVDQKKIHLTSMKVGSSPLYFCDGQESKLENFAHKLSEPNYRVFELLKKSKILRERDQDPQIRLALREIKDFAVPLEVSANGQTDFFWKYYLLSDNEAEEAIREYLNTKKSVVQKPLEKPKPKTMRKPLAKHKEIQSTIGDVGVDEKKQNTVHEEKGAVNKITPKHELDAPDKPVTSVKMTQLEEDEVPEFSYRPSVSFSTKIDTEESVKIENAPPVPEPMPEGPVFPEGDQFFNKVKAYFDTAGIEILDFTNIRKSTEFDFVISLPSNVGSLIYYCKAKSKAKINDGDLSTAFVYGQMKKLPILFITVGDLTKSAQDILDKELKSMFVKKID